MVLQQGKKRHRIFHVTNMNFQDWFHKHFTTASENYFVTVSRLPLQSRCFTFLNIMITDTTFNADYEVVIRVNPAHLKFC